MRIRTLCGILILLLALQLPLFAGAELEDGDVELFGLEAEELLAFISAHVAAALAILTFLAYYRTKRAKLLFVTFAFVLFSIKLFLVSSELFIEELPWMEMIAALLDFAILLSFFYGIIKR